MCTKPPLLHHADSQSDYEGNTTKSQGALCVGRVASQETPAPQSPSHQMSLQTVLEGMLALSFWLEKCPGLWYTEYGKNKRSQTIGGPALRISKIKFQSTTQYIGEGENNFLSFSLNTSYSILVVIRWTTFLTQLILNGYDLSWAVLGLTRHFVHN